MLATLKFLGQDDSAAAAVEYGLLVALIALVALAGLSQMGTSLSGIYDHAEDVLAHHH